MARSTSTASPLTRRQFGAAALAGAPALLLLGSRAAQAGAAIDSRIKNVQFGAITYSFRGITDPEEIIRSYVTLRLGEMELMSNHAEALAGMPPAGPRAGRGAELTPEQKAAADTATKNRAAWKRAHVAFRRKWEGRMPLRI